MSLKETISTDIITAMKAKDILKADALRMLKAEILKLQTSAANVEVSDENVVGIIQKAIKQRKEAAEGFTTGGNTAMAQKELKEVEIYQAYLPAQMSETDLKTIIQSTIAEVGATGQKDIGKVMGALMPKVKGKADGTLINQIVKTLLTT